MFREIVMPKTIDTNTEEARKRAIEFARALKKVCLELREKSQPNNIIDSKNNQPGFKP